MTIFNFTELIKWMWKKNLWLNWSVFSYVKGMLLLFFIFVANEWDNFMVLFQRQRSRAEYNYPMRHLCWKEGETTHISRNFRFCWRGNEITSSIFIVFNGMGANARRDWLLSGSMMATTASPSWRNTIMSWKQVIGEFKIDFILNVTLRYNIAN